MWLKQNLVLILLLAAGFPAVRSDCHDRAQVIHEPGYVEHGCRLDKQDESEEIVVVLDEEEPEPALIQTSEFVSTPDDEDETDETMEEEVGEKRRTRRQLPMTTALLHSLSQECDGIALRWVSPPIPFSLMYHNTNPDFKHYNIYREMSSFTSVVGLTPLASGKDHLELQKLQTNKWIDKFPPTGILLHYAVTVVDHMGLETPIVLPKQISFLGSIEKTGIDPVRFIHNSLKGDVLHHSLAYNNLRNEYMVAFDLDVNKDGSPDHVYASRVNGSGHIMDKGILNVTVAMVTTQQGRPSVAFNPSTQQYLIAFQMSAPSLFGGSSVIVGQRVYGHKTEKLHFPYVMVKGAGNSPIVEPNLIYNSATGGFVMTVMLISPPKTAFAVFLKAGGTTSYVKRLFGGEVFEAQVFMDPMNHQVYFVYQVERSAIILSTNQTSQHRSLNSYPYLILVTRTNGTGTSDPSAGRNLVGFTHEKDASLAGYFDQNNGWLTVFWNNRENGKMRINSSNLFGVHGIFQREENPHSCPTHFNVRNPASCFLPHNNGHMLLWEEGSKLGGFLVKEGTFNPVLGEQRHAKLLYNHHEKRAFVVYQQKVEGHFVLYVRNIHPGSQFSCRVPCQPDEECAMLDVCAPTYGLMENKRTCAKDNGGCSHICHPCTICSLGVTCSCPTTHALSLDGMKCFHKASKPDVSLLYSSAMSMWSASIYHKEKRTTFTKVPIQGKIIVAFFYNKQDKYLYYGDVLDRKIYRAFLDGSNKMTLINNHLAEAMIVEPDAKYLFWTDVTLGAIFRCSLDGTNKMTFVSSVDKPRALALHHPKKRLFWTSWGAIAKIERINIDGSDRKTLFDTGLTWPNGLAIDGSFLYWTDAKFQHIEMSDLDGGNRRVLARKISPFPFALAIAGHSLFWTDWSGKIFSMNKSIPFSSPEVLITGMKKPFSIQTYDEAAVIKASFCSDLGAPIDGKRYPFPGIGGKYRIGDKVMFTCNPGFAHVGSIERQCLSTGMWSGVDIQCKASFCRDLGAPINGKRHPLPGVGGKYKMGDKVTMTCNPGFILHGSHERFCLSTLTWTGMDTHCIAKPCRDPGVPSDGNRYPLPRIGGKYKVGDKVMLTCNPGFVLRGSNERYCLSSGKWTGSDTECKGRPVLTTLPKNQTVDVGSTALLKCSVEVKPGLKPNIKWYKNGKIIPPSTIQRYVQMKSTGVFFIYNALVEDTGTYTCVATNDVGDVRASMYLRVKGYAVSYCGKVTFSKAKMAGVHQAVHGSIPWQVLLWDKQANQAFCEGSLLNERYVITAAHCLYSKLSMLPSIEVRLGKHDLKKVEKTEQKFDIDKVYIHSQYNDKTLDSDIALIHLKTKVVMTKYVKPVCLPVTQSDLALLKPNSTVRISGWGKAQPRISMSCPLQEVLLPFVPQVTCKRNHRQYVLTSNMFCAGRADRRLDICHGDSGSPMTVDNMKTGRSILVGVMSWRNRVCAVGSKYGVYTKVQNYLDWINTQIGH